MGPSIGSLQIQSPLLSSKNSLLSQSNMLETQSNWVLRGLFLAIASLSVSVWNNSQAVFGSVVTYSIQTWCIHKKGPVFVAMFKPLGIGIGALLGVSIAALLGVIFLGDTLYVGSVIGAIVIVADFYGVMWAQSKEEETMRGASHGADGLLPSSSSRHHTPLLVSWIHNHSHRSVSA
ncbi:hypothetical protein LguiA_009513 [Lonicera macranthoides]